MELQLFTPILMALVERAVAFMRASKYFGFINPESKGKVLATAAAVSAIATFAATYLLGTTNVADAMGMLTVFGNALVVFTGSVSLHEVGAKIKSWILGRIYPKF
jgi:hypothetical protein